MYVGYEEWECPRDGTTHAIDGPVSVECPCCHERHQVQDLRELGLVRPGQMPDDEEGPEIRPSE